MMAAEYNFEVRFLEVCRRTEKDERTVKWRAREPALKYGSFMTAAINRD
jgi:hypothetical protein